MGKQRQRELFYDGGIQRESEWLVFILGKKNLPVIVFDPSRGEPGMIVWVNDIGAGAARIHFCGLEPYRRSYGIAGLGYFDSFKDDFGEPMFRVLVGITPENNTKALKLSRLMGFETVGTIRNLCHLAYESRRVGGVVTFREHP
jgi:hypothetical protein